ncbi:MAG TPA: SemiSWEET transporter [Burkholderiaceae bacterium]|nr:SemiSWEET transporter [Burkholderiaceae bacterium]
MIELLGYVAAALTTLSFAPQAWLIFRTRDVSGVSLGMYSALVSGIVLWLVYGLLIRSWPLVVANAVTLSLAGSILVMKLRLPSRRH